MPSCFYPQKNLAVSTPPTDFTDFNAYQLRALIETADNPLHGPDSMTHDDAVQTVKQFCKLATSYNVTTFFGSYDGSGDSGDMDISVTTHVPAPQTSGARGRDGTRVESVNQPFRQWLDNVVARPDALITKQVGQRFEAACFELLPMGWEINDGSYGELTVTVANEEITIEHSERFTDVRHETFNF